MIRKLAIGVFTLAFILPVQGQAMSYFSGASASNNATNVAKTAAVVACVIANGARVALSIEDAINQGKAKQIVRSGTTTTVQATSSDVCQEMGGVANALSAPASPK
jgi:hypothetical protein